MWTFWLYDYTYKDESGIYYIRYQITNGLGATSTVASYKAKVDTTQATASITAKKTGTNTVVNSGTWSDKGLDFTITETSCGGSGCTIKYCKDTNNTCSPSTTVASGTAITAYNTTTGTYYIRYQISSSSSTSEVASYQAKVDTTAPTVSIAAKKSGTSTAVTSGTWSDTGLEFNLTQSACGTSG